jgi:hypothetical protein
VNGDEVRDVRFLRGRFKGYDISEVEPESTTQREARDAWLNSEGITWWPDDDSVG